VVRVDRAEGEVVTVVILYAIARCPVFFDKRATALSEF